MDLRQFSIVNKQRCESPEGFNHPLPKWSLSDWFTAVFGELGEAANLGKKLNRERDGIKGNKEPAEVLKRKMARELADAFIYLDLLAQSQGIDLSMAVVETFNAKSRELGLPYHFGARCAQCGAGAGADIHYIGTVDSHPFVF